MSDNGKRTRKLVIARKIAAGETIKLEDGGLATMPEEDGAFAKKDRTYLPLTLALGENEQYKKNGTVTSRSVLGDPQEFEEMKAWKESGATTIPHLPLPAKKESDAEKAEVSQRVLNTYQRQVQERTVLLTELEAIDAKPEEEMTPEVKKKRTQIHERLRKMRETNALDHWEQQNKQWMEMKQLLARRLNKGVDDLVVSRVEHYREVMEERDIIERALPMYDPAYTKGFWPVPQTIGDELTGVSMLSRPANTSPVERIGRSRGSSRPATSASSQSYLDQRKKQLRRTIKAFQPARPDFDELSVEGRGLASRGASTSHGGVRPLSGVVPQEIEGFPKDTPDPDEDEFSLGKTSVKGPSLLLSASRLNFEVAAGNIARGWLKTENNGTTAIIYEWHRVDVENKLKTVQDSQQRFYFNDVAGNVLPGETYDFMFVFKSPNPGIYYETWELRTLPITHTPPRQIQLKGTALQEDRNRKVRGELEVYLHHNVIENDMRLLLEGIIDNIRDVATSSSAALESTGQSMWPSTFAKMNAGMELHYSPSLYISLQQLYGNAQDILRKDGSKAKVLWDGSISSVQQAIVAIPLEEEKSSLMEVLNELIRAASFPVVSHPPSLSYCIGYDLVVSFLDALPLQYDLIRQQLKLPPHTYVGVRREEGQEASDDESLLISRFVDDDKTNRRKSKRGSKGDKARPSSGTKRGSKKSGDKEKKLDRKAAKLKESSKKSGFKDSKDSTRNSSKEKEGKKRRSTKEKSKRGRRGAASPEPADVVDVVLEDPSERKIDFVAQEAFDNALYNRVYDMICALATRLETLCEEVDEPWTLLDAGEFAADDKFGAPS